MAFFGTLKILPTYTGYREEEGRGRKGAEEEKEEKYGRRRGGRSGGGRERGGGKRRLRKTEVVALREWD
jgi:hypothetical protein